MTEKEKQKISQNESENNVYKAQLDKYFNNQMPSHEIINVCSTPNILKVFNSAARKVVLYQSVLENAVSAADFKNQKHSEGHDIAKLEIYKLPESIRSPILMLKGNGRNSNSIVMLTEMINKKGENVFVPIALDRNKGKISNISTLYGKKNLSKYLSDHLADIMAINIKKADMLANIGVRFPKSIYDTVVCFDDSIAYTTANVKNLSEKVQTLFSEKVKFPSGESKRFEITQDDIDILRTLEPRKSILNFTQAELETTQKWAEKFKSELSEKSPFYRLINGDWRENEETGVPIIDVADKSPTFQSVRNDIKQQIIFRGTVVNSDTDWNIQISRKGLEDTVKYAFNSKNYTAYSLLYYIEDIVKNGTLLDSVICEKNNNSKSYNPAFMHKMYSLCKLNETVFLAKLTIEEFFDGKETTLKRLYNVQDIKLKPLRHIEFTEKPLARSVLNGSDIRISDLFQLVKSFDRDFYLNKRSEQQIKKFPSGESKERNNNMAELTQEALLEKIAALEKQVAAITAEQQTLKEQMNTVNQFISSITESQNFEQSMATIESMGRQVLDCREAEFWCYDSAENKYFSNSEERGGREWKIAEENMRIAAGNKQIHISDGAAYIPIISNDRVSGVLIASGKDGGFNQKDLEKFAPNSQIANTVDLALKKEFEHQGRITDELTRLKNRQGAKEYAANTMAHNVNDKKDMCIIMCDIDHFKSVNDTYGHDAGDTVLKNVAAILQSGTRQGADSAFRWGGEEMVCVLNCDYDHAMDIAERLRAQIENATHLVYDGNRQPANIGVTISMGVHHIKADMEITPQNAFDFFESQLKFADELAYQAKESGRNMVVGGESTIVSEKEKYSLFTVEINGEIMNYRDNNASDIDALMNRYASCGGYLPDFTENCTRITNLEFAEMEQSDTSKPVFCAEINVDNNTLTVWDNEKIADSSLDNAVENIEENGALNLSYRPFAQPDDFEHYTDVTSEKTNSDVINKDSDNITVEGHTGTWYVIDTAEVDGQELFLLENEEYGDETANVIVDENGALVMDDVWNGFDELYEQMDYMAESEEKVYDLEDDVIGEDGFLDKCDDMEQWAKETIEKAENLEKGINGKEI